MKRDFLFRGGDTPRRRIAAAMLGLAVVIHAQYVQAQIPVTDGASIAARAMEHAASLAKFIEQIAVLKSQLESLNRQYEAISGTRNLGELLNNPAIRKSLPDDVQKILKSGDDSSDSIFRSVRRIKGEERLYGDFSVDRKALDKRIEDLGVRTKAIFEQIQEGMTSRTEQLDQLQSQINLQTDPKAIADLQARLLIEQANIQADQIRADVVQRQLAAEKALVEQQAETFAAQSFSIEAIRAPIPGVQ